MPPKRKSSKPVSKPSKGGCSCGGSCESENAYLPGYLFLLLGAATVPVNLGMLPGLEAAMAWPVLFLIIGVVAFARVALCRGKS